MTSTLVESIPALPPTQFDSSVLLKYPQSQPRPLVQSKVATEPWATQLAHLASQHHLSEYSRIKYGHRGCPIPYAPLSLNAPETLRDLRIRQAVNMDAVLWWPCPEASTTVQVVPTSEQRDALVSGIACSSISPLLQRELSAALEDTLSSQISPTPIPEGTSGRSTPVKTSQTHPLNISPIIPPELLPAVSSHLLTNPQPSPTIFHIPDSYTLHRITGHAQLIPSTIPTSLVDIRKARSHLPRRTLLLPPIPVHSSPPPPVPHTPPLPISPNQPRLSIAEALQAAIDTRLTSSSHPLNKSHSSLPFVVKLPPPPILKQSTRVHPLSNGSTSESRPSSPRQQSSPGQRGTSAPAKVLFPSVLDLLQADEQEQLAISVTGRSAQNVPKLRASSALPRQTASNHSSKRLFKLGNLTLSSCPGKKVRLTGPVRGRGAVCRDLETDLRRIREVGARCVVCCLDDEELEFLGISWSDYVNSAHRTGMDVLRIPLPEGLAPLSPQSLDESLTKIIDGYTMCGASVLVHCRGGLGRAGLVACCWALKLGLCGWITVDLSPNPAEGADGVESRVRRDTLQLVERAIAVVRRRRSVKAIETLEQVQFLAEYVDYLREGVGQEGRS
ncbi:phosphatases II [Rhizopogon vinicolor AM-OR11-026]|uniref:Phosphatases II n=1 Tax=Rhizopogon vinicolor AM-OR11-026 TaxID=1314800 RepID=A0A1B7MQU8_9AGAM|nr:phosphatases II [Rhizopogon vinicolor AM-OR11-026]